ncbi:MAG TPA: TolC family protein, partial [Nannocystis sp.]
AACVAPGPAATTALAGLLALAPGRAHAGPPVNLGTLTAPAPGPRPQDRPAELVDLPPELNPTPTRPGPVQTWSLGQVMRTVEANHPRMRAEQLRRQVYNAGVIAARTSIPNPVFLNDNGTAEFTYRVGFTQLLELGGKRRRRVELALARYALIDVDLRVLAASLRAEARRTYMEAFFAQEREKTLIELILSVDELLRAADARPEEIPKSDVLEVRITRLKARQALEQAKFEHFQADLRLNNLLGNRADVELVLTTPAGDRPPRWLVPSEDDWRHEFLVAHEALVDQALRERPELLRVLREREILGKEERLVRANRIPNILASLGPDFVPQPGGGVHTGVFWMLNVEVPLFNRQQGPLKDIDARRAQLAAGSDALRHDIARQVTDAVALACYSQSQYRLYERELVPAADAVYADALAAFLANTAPFLVAVRAQEGRVLVRLEYLRSLAAYHIALAGVDQALGFPAI